MALIAQITAQAWRVSTRSAVGWQALRRRDVLRFTCGLRARGVEAPAERRSGARPFASSENHVSWSDRHAPDRPRTHNPRRSVMAYVDGFVLAVPKDKIEAYKALAKTACAIW